jgi:hypothetical protein
VQRAGFLPVVYGAHAPNRPGKSLVLVPGENRKDVSLLVEPPGVITGHIYDQDGEILPATVQLFRVVWRDGRKRIEQAGGANANDEGEYRLYGLPAGNYIVATAQTPVRPASPVPTHEIYPPTFYPGTEDATGATVLRLAPGSEARNIDLQVRKTVSVNVTGTLVPAVADPGMRLTLSRRDGVPGQQGQLMSPQPGQFAARGITPGSYVLSARTQADYARMNIDVGSLDVGGIELRLAPLLQLPGSLKFDGDMGALSLVLTSADASEPPSISHPDEKGALLWKGLTPGKWTLDFNPRLPGVYLKSPPEIEIGPEGHHPVEVILDTHGASVGGKVQTSAEHPAPVEAATVLLVTEGVKPTRVLKFAITDVDGKYAIPSVPPGKYRVVALEDIETSSWENPDVAQTFEGKGTALELSTGEKAARDLVLSQP